MQGDDPPFLPVGTDVSAKYKGAFCEAKIKKVVRNIKCKLTLKAGGGSITVNDDTIKGTLRVGNTVEVKHDAKKEAMEAIITKLQDCSQYTVVFDDGDITTLRRSALCLKSGRHFNESETLDQLPLTHPEHFSTPVISGRRGRRGRAQSEESEGERRSRGRAESREREPHVGRVVLVEAGGGTERRRPQHPAFPALVVAPTAQDTVKIKVKEDYLVRSFKDGRYYTVPKKEAREFRKGSAPIEWGGVEAALLYLNNNVLPPHWDRDALFNEPSHTSDDSSDDEPREEKDHFVAQLYKFMDDRGTPLNRNPTIANRDVDLYRLFRVVQKLGGYNRVTNQNQWKTVARKMGFQPATISITNLCKQAYKKFLHSFEDFYRKLGVTLVAHPRGTRTPPSGRSLIRDRDKQPVPATHSPVASTSTTPQPQQMTSRSKEREKEADKIEAEKIEEKVEKPVKEKERTSDGEDSADNQPLVVAAAAAAAPIKLETPSRPEKEKDKARPSEDKERLSKLVKSRESRSTPLAPKPEPHERRTPKPRRPVSSKSDAGSSSSSNLRASRRPHASTDSDSSGRASRCGIMKKAPTRRSQSANSASSGNTIASNSSKRPRKRKTTESSQSEPGRPNGNIKAGVGDKLEVYYGPTQPESKKQMRKCVNKAVCVQVTYEAKVIELSAEGLLRVHYTGWNTRYDEWIKPQRIAVNVSQRERTHVKTKGGAGVRRVRPPRLQTDTDSSDEDITPPSKKVDTIDKTSTSSSKATSSKDEKSGGEGSSGSGEVRVRKRPSRAVQPPNIPAASPPKRPRTTPQGRDYDLNEIRSELKGLHTVKPEPEEPPKTEPGDKLTVPTEQPETSQPEKQAEDVYEFKEPEPFEFELHDEKKKRMHRIFDDVSPTKYTSTLSKTLLEEIIADDPIRPRPSLRSPSLSPFRDFSARDAPGRQTPEEDSRDGLFSLDGDSFPGDSSSGPIFEGFTPAKNQETYSKRSKVSKLRKLIDDSPESPADDEQSSEDEPMDTLVKEENQPPEPEGSLEASSDSAEKSPEPIKEESKELILESPTKPKEEVVKTPSPPQKAKPVTPEVETKIEPEVEPETIKINPKTTTEISPKKIEPTIKKLDPLVKKVEPATKKAEPVIKKVEPVTKKLEPSVKKPEPFVKKLEPQAKKLESVKKAEPKTEELREVKRFEDEPKTPPPEAKMSPIDTEEDKSEPDSPARLDLIPEPPAFLLHNDGPKIAEKLLKAISSAKKRLSTSPPPEDPSKTPNRESDKKPETPKSTKSDSAKASPEQADSSKAVSTKTELKPIQKVEPVKTVPKVEPPILCESFFTEKIDAKKDISLKVEKPSSERTSPLIPPSLNILERRKSGPELPLPAAGKSNKVLSDTIQKLSSQINQTSQINATAAASIPLPTFPSEDRTDSSDSDDSDRSNGFNCRLIIDKLSEEESQSGATSSSEAGRARASLAAQSHATKSPVEWSAGESLLMLEDFCKNERKHGVNVVVGRQGLVPPPAPVVPAEEDSNISILLCEETIPGSPAGGTHDLEPAPPRARLHMPFASAPTHAHHHQNKDEPNEEAGMETEDAAAAPAEAERAAAAAGALVAAAGSWRSRPALLHTPPTTPDSSDDMSPRREHTPSDRDSPSERKEEDDAEPPALDTSYHADKSHAGVRSRKASESSVVGSSAPSGARRGRRPRAHSDERSLAAPAHHTPLKYNFYVELDPSWDCYTRINLLSTRLAELRKAYQDVKSELAAVDRRRKKLRRKEREAVKAAKAACA